MPRPRIVPELYCSDISVSLKFYTETLGFDVRYSRPEERFASLDLHGAELMLEQTTTLERTLVAGTLERPFGRGLHLQIGVDDVDALHRRVVRSGARLFLPLEERWYRQHGSEAGQRQFAVQDPDGYLLRFFTSLGERPA